MLHRFEAGSYRYGGHSQRFMMAAFKISPLTVITETAAESCSKTITRSYFSTAEQQLGSPAPRRHSIVPRRHTTNFGSQTIENRDLMSQNGPQLMDSQSHYLYDFNAFRHNSNGMQGNTARNERPIRDLKRLTRKTSHEFGTISGRPNSRAPSLPFLPPFIKNTTG